MHDSFRKLSFRRTQQARAAVLALALLAGVARAEVRIALDLPPSKPGDQLTFAVQQGGRIVDRGAPSAAIGDATPPVFEATASVPDGSAVLYACFSRDTLHSFFPSFGDLFAAVTFEVTTGKAEVRVPREQWRERTVSAPDKGLTIHYHRFDGDYDNAGLWTWDDKLQRHPKDQETFEVGRDEFGLVFQLDIGDYGDGRIGLLPRMNGDWQFKDGGDRFWSPAMGREVYIVQDGSEVFASRPDVSPKLLGARLVSESAVVARFTHRLPVVDFPASRFTIRDSGGAAAAALAAIPEGERDGKAAAYRLATAGPLEYMKKPYTLAVAGFEPRPIVLGEVLVDSTRYYDAKTELGARYTKEATTFGVFSPGAEQVEVILSSAHTGGEILMTHPLSVNDHGVWSARVSGDWKGRFYGFRLQGPVLDPLREVTDIHAFCTTGPNGRGLIVDLKETNPPSFDPGKYVRCDSPVDAIIYELHVRDMTIAPNSGVTRKGKFLGLAEAGTRLAGDASVATALDHLVDLGVTHVQIMPIQDFDNKETDDDTYNWGYMPVNFSSPDGWYATKIVGPERINEFKRLVQALHERGIGVIMDVVYNHTAKCASFDYLCHGYYYRRKPDGSYWDGSGCGNEFASEHPMARKFMVDSVKYWVSEYGVDGFRFDLMGLHDLPTMLAIRDELRKINPSVLVYGEPWTGGSAGLAEITNHQRVAGTGLAAFNDHFRDAVKGERDAGAGGFVQLGTRVDGIRRGVMAALSDWAKQPFECITYCECHDNLTTWDKLLQSTPEEANDISKRMQRFAGLLVLTSQGVPFLQSGQEFCRSKGGNHNSYNAPDSVNQIDWSLKKKNRDVFDYYKGLIALRKGHSAFRLRSADEVRRRLRFREDVPTDKCAAYTIDGAGLAGETHSMTLVLLNGEAADQAFHLPPGRWRVLADADRAGVETLREADGAVSVIAHSGMVLGR